MSPGNTVKIRAGRYRTTEHKAREVRDGGREGGGRVVAAGKPRGGVRFAARTRREGAAADTPTRGAFRRHTAWAFCRGAHAVKRLGEEKKNSFPNGFYAVV